MEAHINFLPKTRTLRKFRLFERKEFFFLIGQDKCGQEFHVLKLLKKTDADQEHDLQSILQEEIHTFSGNEIDEYYQNIIKSSQTVRKVQNAQGVIGFVKFLKGYYIILATDKKKVAKIGRHNIYKIKDFKMIPLYVGILNQQKEEEERYVQIFKDIQIQKGFYFSYTYDLTHRLQDNVIELVKNQNEGLNHQRKNSNSYKDKDNLPYEEKFLWNYFLIKELNSIVTQKKWIFPLIYGFINMINLQNEIKQISFILISRRSRHFAGTRYLKRGLNEEGCVANFVETEQIIYCHHNSFDDKPLMSSFVQIRGSIPLFWTQKANVMIVKPDIILLKTHDSQYNATKRHIAEIFKSYSYPLIILNLTKEFDKREAKVSDEYKHAINEVINPELPRSLRIQYVHYDVKNRKKKEKKTFPQTLMEQIQKFVKRIKIFSCTRKIRSDSNCHLKFQRGIIRTNCIDSLDRTNTAQLLIGYYVFIKQLKILGIIKKKDIALNTDLYKQIIAIYGNMGDNISLQYGGSVAHHSTLNKKKNIIKNISEIGTSVVRHFANNFSDPSRQSTVNLFLGIYIPGENKSAPLWNILNEATLHKSKTVVKLSKLQGKWWENYLKKYERILPEMIQKDLDSIFMGILEESDDEDQSNSSSTKLLKSRSCSPTLQIYDQARSNSAPKIQRQLSMENDELFTDDSRTYLNQLRVEGRSVAFHERSSSYGFKLRVNRAQNLRDNQAHDKIEERVDENIEDDEELDNDPFYELYNCNKLTYLDKVVKSQFSQFEKVDFSNETLEDLIKCHLKRRQNKKKNYVDLQSDIQYEEYMKKFVCVESFVDFKEENKFKEYIYKDTKLQEMGILNYENLLTTNPDDLIKQNRFTKFTENLYTEDDYKQFKDKFTVIEELKSDLELFENYSNFNVNSLDSIKIKEGFQNNHASQKQFSQFIAQTQQTDPHTLFNNNKKQITFNQSLQNKYAKDLKRAAKVISLAYKDDRQQQQQQGEVSNQSSQLNTSLQLERKYQSQQLQENTANVNSPENNQFYSNYFTKLIGLKQKNKNQAKTQEQSNKHHQKWEQKSEQQSESKTQSSQNVKERGNKDTRIADAKNESKTKKTQKQEKIIDSYFDDLFGRK